MGIRVKLRSIPACCDTYLQTMDQTRPKCYRPAFGSPGATKATWRVDLSQTEQDITKTRSIMMREHSLFGRGLST